MKQIILITGLSGTGKTTLAQSLKQFFMDRFKSVVWLNADKVREEFDDWDFSKIGRQRQSARMLRLAKEAEVDYVICDFIAPLYKSRLELEADWTIWMDTEDKSKYPDTDAMYQRPEDDEYDFRITEKNSEYWVDFIGVRILNKERRPVFDNKKETVQMLGRWQPWHKGHRALFEKALAKTGQVVIMIRDCVGWDNSNPFNLSDVIKYIKRDLDPLYQGTYKIMIVPNIVNITYGRKVGYKIEQEFLGEEIENISATKIREEMGIETKKN